MIYHLILKSKLIWLTKKKRSLKDLIALAESSHQPPVLGKILNQALVDKDRREAPHERTYSLRKPK